MVARNGSLETVVDSRGPLHNLGRPVMNDTGAIAFGAIPDSGSPGVYVADNGTLRRVAGTEDLKGFHYDVRLDMNDRGVIAVPSWLGIVKLEDGAVTVVGQGDAASINNEGTVAYRREFSGADTGIFTGPDLTADKVVRRGDPLFGSELRRLTFVGGPGGINDRGDVVFKYELADRREGIAVARVVPEPTSAALPALVVPLLLRRRRVIHRSAAV